MKLDWNNILGGLAIVAAGGIAFILLNKKQAFATLNVIPEALEESMRETPAQRDTRLRAEGATIIGSTPNTVFIRKPNVTPPGYREARAQTQTLDNERRAIRAQFEMSRNYGPLSESKIAKEIQRIPEFNDRPNAGYVPPPIITSYPGFTRRADGLLQWDGRSIPEFLKDKVASANIDCSQYSAEEVVHCQISKAGARNVLDLLRNRPWVPGRDFTHIYMQVANMYGTCLQMYRGMKGMTQQEISAVCQDMHGPPVTRLPPQYAKLVEAGSHPRALMTAEEEYEEKVTNMKTGAISKAKGKISDAAEKSYAETNYPTIGPSYAGEDMALVQKEEAERAARDAAHEAFVEKTEQETLTKLRSQFFGGYVSGSSFRRRREGGA